MASTTRQSTASIEQSILKDGSAFSFNKLISHLHNIVIAKGLSPTQYIRVRPVLTHEVNRSEVVSVTKTDDGIYHVLTSFLGLYGASSPMPMFYTDELINLAQEDQHSTRQFLDIIHQRLYQLHHQVQKKYNSLHNVVELQQQQFSQLLHTITGTRDKKLQSNLVDGDKLLAFTSLLGLKQRSAQGLQKLLSDYLEDIDVSIEQCVERKVNVPVKHQSRLGINSCELGNNALIGSQLLDRKAKITIHLGPVDKTKFDHLMNDKAQWKVFEGLIKAYINTPLEIDIKTSLITQAAQAIALGESKWCQLGYDTWLLNEHHEQTNNDHLSELLISTLRLQ